MYIHIYIFIYIYVHLYIYTYVYLHLHWSGLIQHQKPRIDREYICRYLNFFYIYTYTYIYTEVGSSKITNRASPVSASATLNRRFSPPDNALTGVWQTFSKVSPLLYGLRKITIQLTFENFQMKQRFDPHDILKSLLVVWYICIIHRAKYVHNMYSIYIRIAFCIDDNVHTMIMYILSCPRLWRLSTASSFLLSLSVCSDYSGDSTPGHSIQSVFRVSGGAGYSGASAERGMGWLRLVGSLKS